MAQIFQPELTDSFEIKSNTVSQSDNVMKTVQEIYNYGVNSNYGNCFILYDNADNFLKNKGGYQIRYFTLTSLLTPRKIYLGSSNYLYNNGAIAGGTKIQHAIGVAVRMRSGEYETINVATFSTNGNSYSTIVNTNENFTTSTGGLYGATVYVNEDDYGSDYYTSYYGSGLHPEYDEVIYIDPSIYDELYIDGQLVPKANATIRVNYYLPDDDYKYARITYKKNEKPESVNDGTIVPISPNDSYVDIQKFVEGQSYWFKIFTDKSESEAFPYTVGEILSSWQNVSLPCVTGTSSNDDLWTTQYDDWVSNLPDGITLTYLPSEVFNIPKGSTSWLFGDSSWGIMITCGSASDIQMSRWYNGSIVARTDWFASTSWITSGLYKISIFAAKNDVENKGSMPWIINYNNGQSYFISTFGFNNSQTYDWLNQ